MLWMNWRPLHQAFVHEVGQVVQVPQVVALELEARAAFLAQHLEDVTDVAEGVADDQVFMPST